jgi:hypothetical protein
MTEIKHKAGDKVYWVSSKGFIKGWVKTIRYGEDFVNGKRATTLQYLLTCDDYTRSYMGDEVRPSLIFTSYKEMISYYSKQEL